MPFLFIPPNQLESKYFFELPKLNQYWLNSYYVQNMLSCFFLNNSSRRNEDHILRPEIQKLPLMDKK
jgi:hypothetical protein